MLTCPQLLGHRLSSVTPRGSSSVRRSLGRWPIPQCTMWPMGVVALPPAFHEHLRFLQGIKRFSVQQLIPQFCSVMLSLRQASAMPSPLPVSSSIVRRCPMISSAVYRFRAMPPPSVGWNSNSRLDLVYRRQVTLRFCLAISSAAMTRAHLHPMRRAASSRLPPWISIERSIATSTGRQRFNGFLRRSPSGRFETIMMSEKIFLASIILRCRWGGRR